VLLTLVALLSFILTLFITPKAIWFLKNARIVDFDQQKIKKNILPTSGGVCIAFGFMGAVLAYIFVGTFLLPSSADSSILLAVVSSVLIATFVGLLDDLNVKELAASDKGLKSHRVGLKQWQKPLFTLPAAVPLMVLGIGTKTMAIAGITIDFGLLYPLLLVPLAVVFVSNAYNMLAGINGLESGMGVVSFLFLGLYAMLNQRHEAALLAFAVFGACIAFLIYNRYPARILPGDSLTYLLGAIFVSIAVVGNIEKFAVLCFLPWIAEFFLKARSRFRARSLGILQKDGRLKMPYNKIYSLTHLMMRFNLGEKGIAASLVTVEFVICSVSFLLCSLGFI
jgi:UDP-N-acetylglucosamine--dolichyl-phosphate N-acetylglucosaminephosphotransferase